MDRCGAFFTKDYRMITEQQGYKLMEFTSSYIDKFYDFIVKAGKLDKKIPDEFSGEGADMMVDIIIGAYSLGQESNKTELLLQQLGDLSEDGIYKELSSKVKPDHFRVNNAWGFGFVPEVIILKPISEGYTASLELAVQELTIKKKAVMEKKLVPVK